MSITMYRLAKDEFLNSPDAPGSTQNWYLEGTQDETQIAPAIAANVPSYDAWGNPYIDSTAKHVGGGTWLIAVRFGPIPPLATGLTLWDIDFTGGKEKRYQSIATTATYQATGFAAVNHNGAIGVTPTGVEGVDTSVAKIGVKAKRKYKTTDLPSNYLDTLEQLTDRWNYSAYTITYWGQVYSFEAGELLFLGAVVTIATETELEIDYIFEGSRDRLAADDNAITLVGFPPIDKFGWDYLWVSYQDTTNNNLRVKTPVQANCEQVYYDDEGGFTDLIL